MILDFVRYTKLYFLISAVFLIPSIFSILTYGFQPAIDFTGGSLLELKIAQTPDQIVSDTTLLEILQPDFDINSIQSTNDSYIIRTKTITNQQSQSLQQTLAQQLGDVTEVRFETVGPTLGAELLKKTLYAALLASAVITLYVAFQFKQLMYGVCAILAMFHDTLIVAGVFSLLGHFYGVEVDTLFVTALLTILSFSVHDTIVVYDRIRESLHRHSQASFSEIVNKAIVETLSRSINNSMTIIFMLTALFLLGGATIKWFIFALLIGTITGTYSSTFTAAPLLVVWNQLTRSR